MLSAREVRECIVRAANGEISRKELTNIALTWMLRRGAVPYEPNMEKEISDTIHTLMAMDEGPEYALSDDQLQTLAKRLVPK